MQSVSRLVSQFIPDNYHLFIDLNRPARRFSGTVTISGVAPTTTGQITVHAKDLVIESVTLDGKKAAFSSGENDELTITHPDIKAGKHIVVINFGGMITDAMHGLYPCYFEYDGVKKELLATQFESHSAREVFPCIDEPEAKATFDLSLATEKDVIVLGNMPISTQTTENDRLITTFATTPRMSTYLLAWVVGELHKKTGYTKAGVEVNIWATPAQPAESLDFALDHAVRTIEFFDGYFGTPYPLPKSDHVALPDFSAGAMENWGLITYREIALLTHPTASSISSKQYVASVITHELSHQWFGNLVTMKWWNDLWLNESFATLMEYVALDALHPEWDMWLELSNLRNILALRRDAIDGVQPVQTDVHHPDEISTLFDGAIVYAKGARLLRMLQYYIGEAAFQRGLQEYFASHAYGNTEANDLWGIFDKTSGKDITQFMNIWLSQPGYPVVHVIAHEDELQLFQQRFFVGPHQKSEALWPVPLNAKGLPELLTTRSLTVLANRSPAPRLNVGDTAHFLTKYDPPLLDMILKQLPTLAPLDRLQLLHEQTLLVRGGEVSAASLIPLLDAYRDEASEPVWNIICLAIGELKLFAEDDETSDRSLRTFAAKLAKDQYSRLGWQPAEEEPEEDTKLRAAIISTMLYGRDPAVIETAVKIYRESTLEQFTPELRPLIIGAMVRHGGDPAVFSQLIALYKTTASANLRQDIASGLSMTHDVSQLKELLALVMDSSVVRPQDVVRWFVPIIRSKHGRDIAWEWLRSNWNWISETFGGDKTYDYFPRYAANALKTRKHLEEYCSFFEPMRREPSLARTIAMGISEIEGRVELIERNQANVQAVLAKL